MKKVICGMLVLLVAVGCLSGCCCINLPKSEGGTSSSGLSGILPSDSKPTSQQVEAQLRQEAYPETSRLMSMVGQKVTVSNLKVNADSITFTLRAPHVGQALIEWYDSLEDLEDGALEATVQELLASATPVETDFTLPYTYEGGILMISYTEQYLNAAGCGIREYYNHVYTSVMEEMGVAS